MSSVRAYLYHHRIDALIIGGLALAALIIHLVPFMLYGQHPFGYDTGFYRRYLIEPVVSFPNAIVPGLGEDALVPRIILDMLRFLPLSVDVILYGSFIAFFVLLPGILYVYLKQPAGRLTGALAGIFVTLSSVQYAALSFMLWKNAWGLILLFVAFICLERRLLYAVVFLDIAIALSHKTTAVVYIMTLFALALSWRGRRKEIIMHIALTALAFAIPNHGEVVAAVRFAPQAIFIEWQEFLSASIPFLLLAPFALWQWRSLRMPATLIAFATVVVLYPIAHLPFYQRIFVFADLALAVFAAYGAALLLARMRHRPHTLAHYLYGTLLCIAIGLLAGNLWSEARRWEPPLSAERIERIEEIARLVPLDATILTTSDEAPWFQGWTHAHIAAPGLLHDMHDLEQWMALWTSTSTDKQIAFLHDFRKPLYISTGSSFEYLIGKPAPCLRAIAPDLLYFECAKK